MFLQLCSQYKRLQCGPARSTAGIKGKWQQSHSQKLALKTRWPLSKHFLKATKKVRHVSLSQRKKRSLRKHRLFF